MKNIIAGILLIMISSHLNSQFNFNNQKDNITNYMLKKGLEKNKIEDAYALIRKMTKQLLIKDKISKKVKQNLRENFSKEEIKILKNISFKMEILIKKEKPQSFKKRNNKYSHENKRKINPARPEIFNPIIQKIISYLKEQGFNKENIKAAVKTIRGISESYRISKNKKDFKISKSNIDSLKKLGISEKSISIIVNIIKLSAQQEK
tara:strand:+ start:1473 stop:2090 length:618 start_codon:yes stop_codon:yes gene_type:complete